MCNEAYNSSTDKVINDPCLTSSSRDFNQMTVGTSWEGTVDLRLDKLLEKEKNLFVCSLSTYLRTFQCLKDPIALDLVKILRMNKIFSLQLIFLFIKIFFCSWNLISFTF